jgi:hypothetical protein
MNVLMSMLMAGFGSAPEDETNGSENFEAYSMQIFIFLIPRIQKKTVPHAIYKYT